MADFNRRIRLLDRRAAERRQPVGQTRLTRRTAAFSGESSIRSAFLESRERRSPPKKLKSLTIGYLECDWSVGIKNEVHLHLLSMIMRKEEKVNRPSME